MIADSASRIGNPSGDRRFWRQNRRSREKKADCDREIGDICMIADFRRRIGIHDDDSRSWSGDRRSFKQHRFEANAQICWLWIRAFARSRPSESAFSKMLPISASESAFCSGDCRFCRQNQRHFWCRQFLRLPCRVFWVALPFLGEDQPLSQGARILA